MENKNNLPFKAAFSILPNTDLNNLIINDESENYSFDYQTLIKKEVENQPILMQILEHVNFIDFELKYGGKEVLERRRKNTLLLEGSNKSRPNKDIVAIVPNEDESYVIVMENLLEMVEKIDLGLIAINSSYYFYNLSFWDIINGTLLKEFLGAVAEKSGISKYKAMQYKVRDKLLRQFETTAAATETENEEDVIKINLLNGTYHIHKRKIGEESEVGELKAAKKEDFLKYRLPFSYDPEAKAPIFQKFLDRSVPDKSCQNVLFEFLGYTFTDMKLEKALFLQGPGGNGKSVVLEVVKALLGNTNVSYHSMDNLCDNKGYHRAELGHKLLNFMSETSSIKDMAMFKKLISGEPIDARSPYGRPFTIMKYCKFMCNVNDLPNVENTEAYFRRQLIIPFDQIIPKEEQDIELHNKIINSELAGVFNLVLKGVDRLVTQGKFSYSTIIDEKVNKYKKDNNTVSLFLDDEGWTTSLTNKVKSTTLYQNYRTYCTENGYSPLGNIKFIARIEALHIKIGRKESQNSTNIYVERKSDSLIMDTALIRNILES